MIHTLKSMPKERMVLLIALIVSIAWAINRVSPVLLSDDPMPSTSMALSSIPTVDLHVNHWVKQPSSRSIAIIEEHSTRPVSSAKASYKLPRHLSLDATTGSSYMIAVINGRNYHVGSVLSKMFRIVTIKSGKVVCADPMGRTHTITMQ